MVLPTFNFELELWNQGYQLICGLDEVGRGCFAGPAVVGAVVFKPQSKVPSGLADSKLLTPKTREVLSEEIKKTALAWSVAEVSVELINQLGIGKAVQRAFRQAVKNLKIIPDFLLIDAFYIEMLERSRQKPIVNGDKYCASISAASIVAKVYRDNLMLGMEKIFPGYGFAQHKGYGTKQHQEAIKKLGLCSLHRTSFNLAKFL